MKRWTGTEPGRNAPAVVGIPHGIMADLLGITIDEWLAPVPTDSAVDNFDPLDDYAWDAMMDAALDAGAIERNDP